MRLDIKRSVGAFYKVVGLNSQRVTGVPIVTVIRQQALVFGVSLKQQTKQNLQRHFVGVTQVFAVA